MSNYQMAPRTKNWTFSWNWVDIFTAAWDVLFLYCYNNINTVMAENKLKHYMLNKYLWKKITQWQLKMSTVRCSKISQFKGWKVNNYTHTHTHTHTQADCEFHVLFSHHVCLNFGSELIYEFIMCKTKCVNHVLQIVKYYNYFAK
jgi:hypothetical protein